MISIFDKETIAIAETLTESANRDIIEKEVESIVGKRGLLNKIAKQNYLRVTKKPGGPKDVETYDLVSLQNIVDDRVLRVVVKSKMFVGRYIASFGTVEPNGRYAVATQSKIDYRFTGNTTDGQFNDKAVKDQERMTALISTWLNSKFQK